MSTSTLMLMLMSMLTLSAVAGCGDPCTDPLQVETGTYRSILIYHFEGVEPAKAFPHKLSKSIEMTIYTDLEEVRFKYVRDGKPVEETWTCSGRSEVAADEASGALEDDGK